MAVGTSGSAGLRLLAGHGQSAHLALRDSRSLRKLGHNRTRPPIRSVNARRAAAAAGMRTRSTPAALWNIPGTGG